MTRDYQVKSGERILAILDCLSHAPCPQTGIEVAEQTGYHRATTFRLLSFLAASGYVYKDAGQATYTLGYKAYSLVSASRWIETITDVARPFLHDAASEMASVVHLGFHEGVFVRLCERVDGIRNGLVPTEVGMRLNNHTTAMGKILLSHRTDSEIQELYKSRTLERRTERTIASVNSLVSNVRNVRKVAYATSVGEGTPGLTCVAVPLSFGLKRCDFALSTSMTGKVRTPTEVMAIVQKLRTVAERVDQAVRSGPAAA